MQPPLDDAQSMSVFADMLSVRGDPRGELAHVQLALEHRPHDRRLLRAQHELLAQHDRHFLGPLRTAQSLCRFQWQRGYITEAHLESRAGAQVWERGRWVDPPARSRLPRATRQLLALESAQTLRLLTFTMSPSRFGREQLIECACEVRAARPPRLAMLGFYLRTVNVHWDGEEDFLGDTVDVQLDADLHVSVDRSISEAVLAVVA